LSCQCKKKRRHIYDEDRAAEIDPYMYQVGFSVRRTYHNKVKEMCVGDYGTIKSVDIHNKSVTLNEFGGNHAMYALDLITNENKEKGIDMNSTIVKLFKNTNDAVLVEKILGGHIKENPIEVILLTPHKEEILKTAQKINADNEAKNNPAEE